MSSLYIPESAMAIFAHPDDIEFGCVGTIARWVQSGARIAYVICTSGDVGIPDPALSRQEVRDIREREQRAAARIAGVEEVLFLREPDGLLEPTIALRQRLVREIRRFRPEVVIAGDPTVVFAGDNYINHPDHRAAATAALDATFPAAGQPHVFQDLEADGLHAHKTRKVYISTWSDSDTFVNIEATMDLKIEALQAHESQIKDWELEKMIRQWAAERGKGKEMPYAESFRVITLESDEFWEKTRGDIRKSESPGQQEANDRQHHTEV